MERQAIRLARVAEVSDESLRTLEGEDMCNIECQRPVPQNEMLRHSGGALSGGETSVGKSIEAFLRHRPDFQRHVGEWFVESTLRLGLTPLKPRGRNVLKIKEWTAYLVFSDCRVTFETGYDAEDVSGDYTHHVAAMCAVAGASQWLLGPGQPTISSTYKIQIENLDALRVAMRVFEAFAEATNDDKRNE